MMNGHVHPVAREIAVRTDADAVEATERSDKIQHRLTWHVEKRGKLDLPKYGIDGRSYVSMGNPMVDRRGDDVIVTIPVFVKKGVYPKRYRQMQEWGGMNGKLYGWNWQEEEYRGEF